MKKATQLFSEAQKAETEGRFTDAASLYREAGHNANSTAAQRIAFGSAERCDEKAQAQPAGKEESK